MKRVDGIFCPVYPQFKGKPAAAIRYLLKTKKGICTNTFYLKKLGWIDIAWGNEHLGLKHIIKRHSKEFRVLGEGLSEIVAIGVNSPLNQMLEKQGKYIFENDVFRIVIKRIDEKKRRKFLLTAYTIKKRAKK